MHGSHVPFSRYFSFFTLSTSFANCSSMTYIFNHSMFDKTTNTFSLKDTKTLGHFRFQLRSISRVWPFKRNTGIKKMQQGREEKGKRVNRKGPLSSTQCNSELCYLDDHPPILSTTKLMPFFNHLSTPLPPYSSQYLHSSFISFPSLLSYNLFL